MHEKVGKSSEENKEIIKELIKKLHRGEDPVKVKEEFKGVIKKLTPLQISQAEELLIKEGMPAEEIHPLRCFLPEGCHSIQIRRWFLLWPTLFCWRGPDNSPPRTDVCMLPETARGLTL